MQHLLFRGVIGSTQGKAQTSSHWLYFVTINLMSGGAIISTGNSTPAGSSDVPMMVSPNPAEINSTVYIFCTTSSDRSPLSEILYWTFDNKKVHLKQSKRSRLLNSNRILQISKTQPSDEGTYTCTGLRGNTTVSGSAFLTVLSEDQLTQDLPLKIVFPEPLLLAATPSLVVAEQGDNVTLTCSGSNFFFMVWYSPSENSISTNRSSKYWSSPLGYRLRIYNVTVRDVGEYQCKAYSTKESAIRSVILKVRSSPYLTANNWAVVNASIGQPLPEVKCNVDCYPAATVEWFHVVKAISTDAALVSKGNWSLTFQKVDYSDGGEYFCKATNKLGKTTYFVQINVVSRSSESHDYLPTKVTTYTKRVDTSEDSRAITIALPLATFFVVFAAVGIRAVYRRQNRSAIKHFSQYSKVA
eukprot:m.12150 g.12150  ORF g.12150 m.12150 type:complete len:413 (+) comp23840_c0_seq2:78-1316(+)